MKVLQVLAVFLPLLCLLRDVEANPLPSIQVSNVDCAGLYVACLDKAYQQNPFGIKQNEKQCKGQVRNEEVCQGVAHYRSEDNLAVKGYDECPQCGNK